MKRAFLSGVGLLLVVGTAGYTRAATVLFHMNTAPDEAAQPWSVNGSTELRSVTDGVLKINDEGLGFLQYRFTLSGSNRTLEARLKMDSSNPNGSFGCAYLGFLVSYTFEGTYVYLETNRLCLTACHSLQRTNLNLANGYHVIRLAQDDSMTRLFVDGTLLFSCSQCQNDPDVSFGAASIPAQGDSSWDYVAFTDTGAFDPDEFSFQAPHLRLVRQDSGINLSWNSFTNFIYQVQSCSNLTTGQWVTVGDAEAGTGSTNSFTEMIPPGPGSRIFRVLAQPEFEPTQSSANVGQKVRVINPLDL